MARVRIYHNPRCSKSRQTLELLRSRGIEPEIIRYLETPPTRDELLRLLDLLGLEPLELMRTKEKVFQELGLAQGEPAREALIDAMLAHPVLLERPIVVCGDRAAIGRPPEAVLDLLP